MPLSHNLRHRADRFLSRDPFPGLAQVPLTLHRYRYAGTDPVNCYDPSGAIAITAIGR